MRSRGVTCDDIKNAIDRIGVNRIIIRERPNPRCFDELKASGDICASSDIGDITDHPDRCIWMIGSDPIIQVSGAIRGCIVNHQQTDIRGHLWHQKLDVGTHRFEAVVGGDGYGENGWMHRVPRAVTLA